ncbi:DUF5522 domain-containing protein [Roseivirga sp. E12]|uniref:DUF5522 domain-containing protein n=1 Tax=Roseivirga sp. E12 TaxID=2819237 RepID=UPI001ABBF9E4|nr:DUF5522 domain-containing protein [Roseivirga sp. E12]MBO3699233.1 hypothetical protein [Roseivirga sp. E12]
MSKDSNKNQIFASKTEDYYIGKDGKLVFTELYLLKRGYCCQNGCRHCPYGFKK